MKLLNRIIVLFLIVSCSPETETANNNGLTLEQYISGKTIDTDAVIACAASAEDSELIYAFFYPELGASNYKYFETSNLEFDAGVFEKYTEISLETTPVFNGHLRRFTRQTSEEKWVIITFELEGEIKISNPIRLKHVSKPTVWNNVVAINQETPLQPEFSWEANAVGDNAIYFQVISNTENDLLSGTYTYENQFQYSNFSNVVLNINTETPPELISNSEYNFTLMDVSLDNWVNLVIQKPFIVE